MSEELDTLVFKGIVGAPNTEFSVPFVQGMANRMAISYHKYGAVAEAYPDKVDAIKSLEVRLQLYLVGGEIKGIKIPAGNREYLIDVANFAMIEFMFPKHAGEYFEATDSNKSPGRVLNTGELSVDGHGAQQISEKVKTFYNKTGD